MFLQPLDQKQCLVPHLKDLIHICLEPEAQERGVTFRGFLVGQNDPKIHHKMQIIRELLRLAVYFSSSATDMGIAPLKMLPFCYDS